LKTSEPYHWKKRRDLYVNGMLSRSDQMPNLAVRIVPVRRILDAPGKPPAPGEVKAVPALVVDRRKSRSDRDIKEEIRRLERERKLLREERRDRDVVKIERIRERSPSRNRAIIIEERGDEVIEVRKDRRGNMALVR
jgi:hypothetical protein